MVCLLYFTMRLTTLQNAFLWLHFHSHSQVHPLKALQAWCRGSCQTTPQTLPVSCSQLFRVLPVELKVMIIIYVREASAEEQRPESSCHSWPSVRRQLLFDFFFLGNYCKSLAFVVSRARTVHAVNPTISSMQVRDHSSKEMTMGPRRLYRCLCVPKSHSSGKRADWGTSSCDFLSKEKLHRMEWQSYSTAQNLFVLNVPSVLS